MIRGEIGYIRQSFLENLDDSQIITRNSWLGRIQSLEEDIAEIERENNQ